MWSDTQNRASQVIPGLTRGDLPATRARPVPGLTRDLPASRMRPATGFAPPSALPQRAFCASVSIYVKKKSGKTPAAEAP